MIKKNNLLKFLGIIFLFFSFYSAFYNLEKMKILKIFYLL